MQTPGSTALLRRRSRTGERLFQSRRLLLTRASLHDQKHCRKVQELLGSRQNVPVAATCAVHQAMEDTSGIGTGKFENSHTMSWTTEDRGAGRAGAGHRLARVLVKRTGDILTGLDRRGASNGPTQASKGSLEHVRGSALGSRESGEQHSPEPAEARGLRPKLHFGLQLPPNR